MANDVKKKVPPPRKGREPSTEPPVERLTAAINLIELRPGLFLNVYQIVSVRVLPQEEGNSYAILQLSNGDKLEITRSEFSAITGQEPRLPARLLQRPPVEKQE